MRRWFGSTRWFAVTVLMGVAPLLGCSESAPEANSLPDLPPQQAGGTGSATAPGLPAVPELTPEEAGRVVAEINGTPVSFGKVREVAEINKLQLRSRGVEVGDEEDLTIRRQALGVLIDSELLYQAAKQAGLSVNARQLEQRIQDARSKFRSEQEYKEYLRNARIEEQEIRRGAERKLLVEMYVQQIKDGVKVPEEAVRKLYEQRKQSFVSEEKVHAAFILASCTPDDPQAKRDDARARMEEAHKKIMAGEDFGKIAREYSQVPSAAQGGDVGFFGRGEMVPKFEDVAFSTPAGEVSEVFETVYGFNILKVIERQEPRQLTFEEVKPTLTLLAVQQEEAKAVDRKIASLRKAADINILDEEFSAGT